MKLRYGRLSEGGNHLQGSTCITLRWGAEFTTSKPTEKRDFATGASFYFFTDGRLFETGSSKAMYILATPWRLIAIPKGQVFGCHFFQVQKTHCFEKFWHWGMVSNMILSHPGPEAYPDGPHLSKVTLGKNKKRMVVGGGGW